MVRQLHPRRRHRKSLEIGLGRCSQGQNVSPRSLVLGFRSGGLMVSPRRSIPTLVFRLRGAGIAEIPLADRAFTPFGVEVDGRRVWLLRSRVDFRPSFSSMRDILPTGVLCAAWLLSEERGRRLSVVGFVE